MDFNWLNYFKNNILIVIISLLVGIFSHIFWDSFTHRHGDFVKIIPLLRENTTILGYNFTVYNILQNISSIMGTILVFYAIMRIPKATNYAKSRNPVFYWFIVIGTGVVAANIRILTGMHYWEYYNVAASALSGVLAGSIIAPLFLEKGIAKP